MQTVKIGRQSFLGGGLPVSLRTTVLGQTSPWGTPTITTNPSWNETTGATPIPAGTKCYKCGTQPPRVMTPTMAAMVPGGCVEVAAGECGAAPTPDVQTGTQPQAVPVCPTGMDALVCEVTEKQLLYKQVYDQQLLAWGTSPQAQNHANDQAHAIVSNFNHPALKAHWDTYSWWIGDMGILPQEWPDLIKYHNQIGKVWGEVPWPKGELDDLFVRCASGVILHNGMSIRSPRLYVGRYSGFFPKTDEEIRKAIATRMLENIPTIYSCMEHKIKNKIRDMERSSSR